MDNETLLDGLAWASIPEHVKIARIANALVVRQPSYDGESITKAKVKERVKSTFPPHGRGKAMFDAVYGTRHTDGEFVRQLRIHNKRQEERVAHQMWLAEQRKLPARLNNAYAARFGRVSYEPYRSFKGIYHSPEREEWEAQERLRDKGDECVAITHYAGHTVALVREENGDATPHVATRKVNGPIVRTYLRRRCRTLVEAIIELGGPRVATAIAKGKRVETDWVKRETRIHHDGSDHEAVKVEVVPWRTAIYEVTEEPDWCNQMRRALRQTWTLTVGDRVVKDVNAREPEEPALRSLILV